MLQTLAEKLRAAHFQRILRNFISLSVVQALNYALPLVTVPYLTRVLGPAKLGLFGFATSFIAYFNILTDYGFNLTATRDVSIHRDDLNRVSLIYSSVMLVKACICLFSLAVVVLIVFSFDIFRNDAAVYLLAFGVVVGNVLSPGWLFQGMEQMSLPTYVNGINRVAVTVALFFVVRHENDVVRLVALNTIGGVATGIMTMWLVRVRLGVRFVRPTLAEIKHQVVDGWYVFISSVSIVIYTSSPTFMLGLLTNQTITGYYTAADKVRQAIQTLFTPFFQAVYPHVTSLAQQSRQRAIRFMRYEVLYVGAAGVAISLVFFAGAAPVIRVLCGRRFLDAVPILRVLTFVPLMVLFGNIFTVQGLLAFGLKKDYLLVYSYAGVIGLAVMISATIFGAAIGTALSVLFVEVLVVALTLDRLNRAGVRVFGSYPVRSEGGAA